MFTRIPTSPDLEVIYWRREAAKNEVLRRKLHWAPLIGLPAAFVAFVWSSLLAILFAIVSLQIWFVGLYMTLVRRHEFADNLRCAEAKRVYARNVSRRIA